tara:strand:- start:6503 stop:7003 length:501 start_codon:yes stop_codon:yes gene_type:complete
MKIFLIGPMGSGKSTIGKVLSERLEYDFYDTDKLVEKVVGKKIKEIFEQNGEQYFRLKESEELDKTRKLKNAVIATGGGIIENEKNRLFLKEEKKVIFLDSSIERQYDRTKESQKRPLLNNGDSMKILKELYQKRLSFYQEVSKLKISMDNLTEGKIFEKILDFLD